MRKVQFNAQIPKRIAERIRADARRSGKSLDDVVTAILSDFLGGWSLTEREKFYAAAPTKKGGRPIASVEEAA